MILALSLGVLLFSAWYGGSPDPPATATSRCVQAASRESARSSEFGHMSQMARSGDRARVLRPAVPFSILQVSQQTLEAHSDVVIDEEVRVSPLKVQPIEFPVSTQGTRVLCTFSLQEGRSGVRAVLLKRDAERRWLNEQSHDELASTPYSDTDGFSAIVDEPGEYAIMIDNRLEGRDTAVVRLQVRIVSGAGMAAPVQTADSRRAGILVWSAASLALFLILFSAWRIKLAIERKIERESIMHWLPPDQNGWSA